MAVRAEPDAPGGGERPGRGRQAAGHQPSVQEGHSPFEIEGNGHFQVRRFAADRMDRDSTGLQQRGFIGPGLGAVRRVLGVCPFQEAAADALRRLGGYYATPVDCGPHAIAVEPLERLRDGYDRDRGPVAAGVAALSEPDPVGDQEEAAAGRATDPVILVHDAARPLASPGLVRAVAEAAARHGAAIPVVPVTETLKRLDGDLVGVTVDRTDVVAAQTPQGLRRSLLERAYAQYPPDGPETWTDEASLLEACRIPVHAISGEATNLKVTVPLDLERAVALLDGGLVPGRPATSSRGLASAGRIGFGTDSHPFGPGEPLVLGGLRIEGAPRLSGHSDGDVALHAVADALLGAAGLGDLGRLFPSDDRTPAGVDSRVLLGEVSERVRSAGWVAANVDLTIVAARPKLAALLPAMGEAIAAALDVAASAVNVKASTGNLGGPEGAGRSISASAIAWLIPANGARSEPEAGA
jgi:2-C-methyl-D-erythritol 4-phosphate cytidylyltransferase/2-C-methyl-D-erythritol 2,4-cyclodiphosphate synthase